MYRRILVGLAATGIALGSQASLARDHDGRYAQHYDYARVVDVDPVVERYRVAEPVQDCWNETRYDEGRTYSQQRTGATLLGGLLGAVIGHQVGHGSERKVGMVAGAVLGGAVGNQVAAARSDDRAYREEPRAYDVQRCTTRHEDRFAERVVAYRVTYIYNGREHRTELPYDPGRRIRVAVHPAE